MGTKGFFQFEIIINVLACSFRFIWIMGHRSTAIKNIFYLTVLRCQNLPSTLVRFRRLNRLNIKYLKEIPYNPACIYGNMGSSGHCKYFYSYSMGTGCRRQNLTSTDVRFWRLKSVTPLKWLNRNQIIDCILIFNIFLCKRVIYLIAIIATGILTVVSLSKTDDWGKPITHVHQSMTKQ